VHDAGVPPPVVELYRELVGADRFATRAYVMLTGLNTGDWLARGPLLDPHHRLTVRAVKLVADGALGSRGAALLEDYTDEPGNRGLLVTPPERIYAVTRAASEAGFQTAVHAIGDRANREVLDIFERIEREIPRSRELRLRDEHLRVGYLKVFMDGTLGSQTAWMLDGTGVRITSGDELAEIVRRAAEAGWPVGVHAIGDRANREALDAFESTREAWAPLGLRQRIEHAQCLAPEDVVRFAELGVACSVQFSHAPSDRDLADRFWPDKAGGAYAFRSLWDSGAVVANGSDAPVEELDPLAGIRAGVLRTIDDRPAWHPDERLTMEQALRASTVNPAWLAGDEHSRGRLLPGYLADLVVLTRDPLDCPEDELESVQVVATMMGGRWVHNPPPWS